MSRTSSPQSGLCRAWGAGAAPSPQCLSPSPDAQSVLARAPHRLQGAELRVRPAPPWDPAGLLLGGVSPQTPPELLELYVEHVLERPPGAYSLHRAGDWALLRLHEPLDDAGEGTGMAPRCWGCRGCCSPCSQRRVTGSTGGRWEGWVGRCRVPPRPRRHRRLPGSAGGGGGAGAVPRAGGGHAGRAAAAADRQRAGAGAGAAPGPAGALL